MVWSGILCCSVVIGFLIVSEQFWHWFVVPVGLCGVVIGVDAVDWLRGRLGALDPVGLLGLLGWHFFFLAPLLHVYGRTLPRVLLTDLTRADVQAFLLYRLMRPDRDYHYARGRTYVATAMMAIPKSVWPDRPPGKIKEGTEALFGRGTYIPGVFQALRVYGVAGEAMLNFGPLTAPLSYALLGIVVSRVRRWFTAWPATDPRRLLLPYLMNLCWLVLTVDSENIAFYLVKYGTVPFLVVLLGCRWRLVRGDDRSGVAP